MKKILVCVLFLGISAFGEVKSFVINDLILLEMPGKMIKSGALDLSSEQMIPHLQRGATVDARELSIKNQ